MSELVEMIDLEALDEQLIDAWRVLARAAVEANPFFEPDFLIPALHHLDPTHAVRLLTVNDGGELLLAVPVVNTRWGPAPVRALTSWRHDYCFLGTPLVHRAHADSAVTALMVHMARDAGSDRLGVFEWMTVGGPAITAFERAAPPSSRVFDVFERPFLVRREDADYLAALGKENLRGLTRRRRALERDLGAVHVVDESNVPGAVDRFLVLEAAGWKGEQGTAMASQPSHAEFFRDMTTRFAEQGRFELRSLATEDGRILAMATRLVVGDEVFCFKTAHDESYRKYAPGLQLEAEILPEFHERSQASADSCTDLENMFYVSLFSQRRSLGTFVMPAGRTLGPIVMRSLPAFRRGRAILRRFTR